MAELEACISEGETAGDDIVELRELRKRRMKHGYSARCPRTRRDCDLNDTKGTQVRLEVANISSKGVPLHTVVVAIVENL